MQEYMISHETIAVKEQNIILRKLTREDAPALFSLIDSNRAHLSQHGELTAKRYKTLDSVIESILLPENPFQMCYGIWKELELIGNINLTLTKKRNQAKLGYYLGKQYTRKGYMTRSVIALTQYASRKGVNKIIAFVKKINIPSIRVLEKAGYQKVKSICGYVGEVKMRFTVFSEQTPTSI